MSGVVASTVGCRSRTSRFSVFDSCPVYCATETPLPNGRPFASDRRVSVWSLMSATCGATTLYVAPQVAFERRDREREALPARRRRRQHDVLAIPHGLDRARLVGVHV